MNKLVLFLISIAGLSVSAQVSHRTGFYPVDSVFFSWNYVLAPGEIGFVSINRFTDDGFVPYTGGVWLYNVNSAPNSWEDQAFSMGCQYPVDTAQNRGILKRVNVVRTRVMYADSIVRDSIYFIGVQGLGNTSFPHTVPVVHIYVDSMNAFGPRGFYGPGEGIIDPLCQNEPESCPIIWNYSIEANPFDDGIPRDYYEKPAHVQILNQNVSVIQNVGIRVAGNSSNCRPNKGLGIVARKEYGLNGNGLNSIKTNLYGSQEKYKWIKFRSGGTAQLRGFGTHEIGIRIIDGLHIGEVPNTGVVTYLNGSFWSFSFAQDKPNQYAIERYTGVNKDSVDILVPIPIGISVQQILDLFPNADTSSTLVIVDVPDFSENVPLAIVDEGNPELMETAINALFQMDTTSWKNQYEQLMGIIELDSWLRYIALINFFLLTDVIQNNAMMVTTSRNQKPFILMEDFDDAGTTVFTGSNWDRINEEPVNLLGFIISNIILENPYAINRLVLVYQDLINTYLLPERTVPIVGMVESEIIPEYEYYFQSWGGYPNAGTDFVFQQTMFSQVKNFYENRPVVAMQQLADMFMSSDSFSISDRKLVQVKFDSIIPGIAKVQFNSLELSENFSGHYFPKPALEIEIVSEPGYEVFFQEYPDSGMKFSIFADSTITLTLGWKEVEPLPIELIDFSCSITDKVPELSWITASEENHKEFIIESSVDAVSFFPRDTVVGRGTVGTITKYQWADQNPPGFGSIYYRLKQVDYNGEFTYSPTCSVVVRSSELKAFPNPFSGLLQFPELMTGVLVDICGKPIINFLDTRSISTGNIAPGFYFLHIDGWIPIPVIKQ